MRLNVSTGQQCVRDFFVLINQNLLNWPDVYNFFAFQIINSTTCSDCGHRSASETTEIYEEISVPPHQSSFKVYVEQIFNEATVVDSFCSDYCKKAGRGERRHTLKSIANTKYITILLSRAIETAQGFKLVNNQFKSTDTIELR